MDLTRRIGLLGLAGFAGLVVVQHAWRGGELPPAEHFVSEYARGGSGWVQQAAFAAWAAGLAATARVAWGVAGGPRRRPVARGLTVLGLSAGAGGAVLCAAFASQTVAGARVASIPYTTEGLLHDRGSQVLALALLLAALASVRLVDERRFRVWVLGCAVGLLAVPSALVAAGIDAPGWGQRGIIAVGLLWQWRLLAAARPAG